MVWRANGNISRFKKCGKHDLLGQISLSAKALEKVRNGARRGDAHEFTEQPYRRHHQALIILDDAQQFVFTGS